ncbi:hypothetical protein MC885_006514 [Smutsia gigantea]|nr:hypothetical protein MC885_006514 [Smutsia gigantea]
MKLQTSSGAPTKIFMSSFSLFQTFLGVEIPLGPPVKPVFSQKDSRNQVVSALITMKSRNFQSNDKTEAHILFTEMPEKAGLWGCGVLQRAEDLGRRPADASPALQWTTPLTVLPRPGASSCPAPRLRHFRPTHFPEFPLAPAFAGFRSSSSPLLPLLLLLRLLAEAGGSGGGGGGG